MTNEFNLIGLDELPESSAVGIWAFRAAISRRKRFGTTDGRTGTHLVRVARALRRQTPHSALTIVFASVATHNHFVLDRGGKVFKQTAPVIKLPPNATEDDHLALLGLLNSSTACSWLKQVMASKGIMTGRRWGCSEIDRRKVHLRIRRNGDEKMPIPFLD